MMTTGDMDKIYKDGEAIVTQGEVGECLYVIQSGTVEVVQGDGEKQVHLTELGEGDFFGEMDLFQGKARSTSVRARGEVRVLTVDKRTLLRKIREDPALAFRLIQELSSRLRERSSTLARIKATDRRDWDRRPDRKGRAG